MSEAELSDADRAALRQVEEFRRRQAQVPPSERRPITNPDKYNFPVGLDDQGKPFPPSVVERLPVPPAPRRRDKEPAEDAGRRDGEPERR